MFIDENAPDSVGHRIKTLRIQQGMTQEELAEALHTTKATISAYENDRINFKVSVLMELSRILHTTPNEILGVQDEEMDIEKLKAQLQIINELRAEESKELNIWMGNAFISYLARWEKMRKNYVNYQKV